MLKGLFFIGVSMANIELYSRKADLLPEKKTEPLIEQLHQAFYDAGLEPPKGPIQTDGQIPRFSTSGRPDDDAGWYCIFGDNIPAGVIGNWRTGETHNFRASVDRRLSFAEEAAIQADIARARKQREEATRIKHEHAAATVAEIWDAAQLASPEHPYLSRKQIQTHGARIASDGRLILPLFNESGVLSSLQYIDATGRKQYHPGGAVGSCYYMMGDATGSDTIYIAEGFATAATICETMHAPTVAAYSANNLPGVAGILRSKYPLTDIVIVADNDISKTGENYATQSAAKHGARVVLIPNKGQDANDYAILGGDLRGLLLPQSDAGIKALDIISAEDIGDDYIPPDEVVQGLFVAGNTAVMYGASNSGKTFLAIEAARAVSSGDNFLGLSTDKGDVLYIAAESPASIRTRIQAINKERGGKLYGIHIAQAPVNLYSSPEYASHIIKAVSEIEDRTGRKIRMIICDTLARITAGANENSGEDMGPIIETLDAIARKTNTAMIIIHHSGKDQARGSRGWSGIYGAVDAEIEVKEDNGKRLFRVSKQRQLGTKEQVFGFDLKIVTMGVDKWGQESTTCVVIPATAEEEDKLETEKSTLLDCCIHLGDLDKIDGKLFVSTSALARALFDLGFAKSETSAKQQSKPSAKGCLCNKLKTAGIIKHQGCGYVILDPDISFFIEQGKKGKL
jgi:putative DNA primase/helicase